MSLVHILSSEKIVTLLSACNNSRAALLPNFDCATVRRVASLKKIAAAGAIVMAGTLGRVLIIDDQQVSARRVGAIAERLGFTTRILRHTLDFEYVMHHWHPDIVAVQMAMPDQQEIEVLEYLQQTGFPGRLLLTGNVNANALVDAAKVARDGAIIASVLTMPSSDGQIEGALKLILGLERAA